ncbi:S41 family peptidase [Polaribacter dokdonensis]|uniref:Tricorn protease homolog n=1 Tax=Polaribacter dokdonensis DSW-5 TaxID=1300348 RepID=A0A0N0UN28_9FLAO|nr:S41 family peptidase [Polaribacter dokdonensis]KOY50468.1 Peptidase family S41 [Polaribacter dokdonensis DSW-5]SEE59202.1 tricorn protease [Polaribacter dokdonensis DSW-5]
MKKIILLFSLILTYTSFSQGTRLLRQPTLSNNQVVFVHAADLWKAPINGGNAIRLTSDEGYESSPKFSKDGQWIAFTAQYDGNIDVYVVSINGGEPKRLTYHSASDIVQGWTPDGKILFRSNREGRPTQTNKFFTISTKGGLPEAFDIPRAAFGEISEDNKYIAYTPITSWDAEWRNYRGGQAMPIWIVNLKTKELIKTPQLDGERHVNPVWFNGDVYYISERDYTANIWSYNIKTKQETQVTFHKKFDVKNLDANQNGIVYEQAGFLHMLNPTTKKSNQIVINVKGDLNYSRTRWMNVSGRNLTNPNVSPKGKRAIFEYRGEIFTIPKENGTWRNLTNSSGVADRSPIWSPKGDKVAWFSDKNGEYELVLSDQTGANQEFIKLPNPTFYFQPDWSPDGKHIAYTDTNFVIWIINLDTKNIVKADADGFAHPNRTMNPKFSPDSDWIVYVKQNDNSFKSVYAYQLSTKKIVQITDRIADAISPVWDASGKYIYTLASTDYGLQTGWLDMSSYDPSVTRTLYSIVLNSTDKAPNLPKTDEEEKPKSKSDDSKKKEDKKENSKKTIIDENGIFDRAVALDLPASNYVGLLKGPKNKVFIAESKPNTRGLTLHSFDVAKEKATVFATGVSSMTASSDASSILLSKGSSWSLNKATAAKAGKESLKTNLKIKVDPKAEAHQIFKEGWRFMRDFLYVDNVHGAPWNDIYKWYSPWINDVRHRTDLNYVVDIMSGEVAIGHSYVSGGDLPNVNRVAVGLLGADLEKHKGYYRFKKIYKGERWNPNIFAPLGLPGINVNKGDYLVAINGVDLTSEMNPYQLLEQTAGREIYIKVNDKPSLKDAKSILITPTASERGLRNIDWVESNRRKVDELSNGKLAYVYVPNTSNPGFTSFNRYYFSQQDKKGVVIDERNNGGGSAADYMIDIMSREVVGYFNSKSESRKPWTTPMAGIWGPKVMIINERAGSGGDLLPYMFKVKNLGTLVGTRTWGGLVGTWDTPRFIDGGRMIAPRGGFYDVDGNWAVEAEGVAPDIEVHQTPKEVLSGKDPQLERAVAEALRLLKGNEFILKPEPKAPIRSKRPKGYQKDN